MNYTIGVDIGGTNIRTALLDQNLNIIRKEACLTENIQSTDHFFHILKEMVRTVDPQNRAYDMGVVIPAPWCSGQQHIIDATNTGFLENVCVEDLCSAFPRHQIVFENDVNAIALLETEIGSAKGSDTAIYITVSTGIGCGIVIDHRIYRGANGYAGEIGNIPVFTSGLDDSGKSLVLEDICGGKAMAVQSEAILGEDFGVKELFRAYEDGDKTTEAAVNRWLLAVSNAVVTMILALDPEVVVLGGPLVLNHSWVLPALQKRVKAMAFGTLSEKITLRTAAFGNDAGVIGAGYCASINRRICSA